MGKGWGSVDVDTDWVVGEASGGDWGQWMWRRGVWLVVVGGDCLGCCGCSGIC